MALPSWAANKVLTAAALNAAFTGLFQTADDFMSYTPTLVQSGAVTKTVGVAHYFKLGRITIGGVTLAVTGSGTAANEVRIGLPVAATSSPLLGAGYIVDASAGLIYKGLAFPENANYFTLLPANTTTGGRLGADTFTAALAPGDSVSAFFIYRSAA